MKITWKQIDGFLKSPDPAARVILVYGPDAGLVKERAKILGLTIVSDYHDPFNVALLDAEMIVQDPARLADEAGALSMMGGDRLIRIENAGDKITIFIKDYLTAPNPAALIVMEAENLGPRSSLRLLCEKAKNAAALPCYVEEERDIVRLIRESVQKAGLEIAPDAAAWLAANITGDRQKARMEIEKLIIYKGAETSPITLEEVQNACGGAGARSLDDLIYAVAAHQAGQALRSYDILCAEGVAFMAILRALQNHFRRLHATKARLIQGEPLDQALKKLQPPVFFKQADAFKTALQSWSLPALTHVLERLSQLEAQCKQTGALPEIFLSQAILGLSYKRPA